MKRVILMLLFVSPLYWAQAQQSSLDSLLTALSKSKEDTSKVFTLLHISVAYYDSNPDTALQYAQQALEISQKISFQLGEAQAMNIIANIFYETGNYIKALESQFKLLEIWEKRKDYISAGVSYNTIGIVYSEQEDYRNALHYLGSAKDIFQRFKRNDYLVTALLNIGDNYEKINELDSALFYENKAYNLARQIQDKDNISTILTNLGNIHYKLGNSDSALNYYKFSIPAALSINDKVTLADAQLGIARIFEKKSLADTSIAYAKRSLAAAVESSYSKGIMNASTLLYNIYEAAKNVDSAFFYYKKATITRDTIFNAEIVRKAQILSTSEQLRQKEIEAARKEFRNKVILIVSLAALSILLMLALFLYRNNRQKQQANNLLQKKNYEIAATLEQLKTTQKQLIQSEKMASLGALTAGIAHEIQNPLNFVKNFSEVNNELIDEMSKGLELGETTEVKALYEDVRENNLKIIYHGKRADTIVKAMLEHSRTSSGKKEPTDINALCDEYLRLSYQGLRAKDKFFSAVFKTNFDESVGEISVVRQDIGRVMLNLYNNSFYSVYQKKKVLADGYEPLVKVCTRKEGGKIFITVHDNGIGIPENEMHKIFQPFFTSKPTGQGTGLGLSLSYDIILGHGGDIKVTSKENEFAEFTVELPA